MHARTHVLVLTLTHPHLHTHADGLSLSLKAAYFSFFPVLLLANLIMALFLFSSLRLNIREQASEADDDSAQVGTDKDDIDDVIFY